MASNNAATIRVSLQIFQGNLQYQSNPQAFNANVNTGFGPSPGAITATTHGTDVSFTQLTQPGLCRLMNLDPNNKVVVGVWDPVISKFFPLIDLLPGEFYLIRLSSYLGEEYGTASASGSSGTNVGTRLRLKAENAACLCLVEGFDS